MYPAAAIVVLHCIVIIISTSGLIHVTYWVPAELLECFHRTDRQQAAAPKD